MGLIVVEMIQYSINSLDTYLHNSLLNTSPTRPVPHAKTLANAVT